MTSSLLRNRPLLGTTPLVLALFLTIQSSIPVRAQDQSKTKPKAQLQAKPKTSEKSSSAASKLETHLDLIQKAQNLTLQRDRIQASQVLTRGIRNEAKGSSAYKELIKALTEHASIFYTEKAQGLYSSGEALVETNPTEALARFQDALRVEDGNLTILKSIARTYLNLNDCDRAETTTQAAESIHPFSPEVVLLGLQILSCRKNTEALKNELQAVMPDLSSIDLFTKGLEMQVALSELEVEKSDSKKPDIPGTEVNGSQLKKAKSILTTWEASYPDYPELYFWKWKYSQHLGNSTDRAAAVKYLQLCQNLTPRKRKTYATDVDLCKGKPVVETFLKDSVRAGVPADRE